MKKKVISLKVESFRGDSITFYPMKGNGIDRTVLKEVFSELEIKQIEKHFNQFYKLISQNCIDVQAKQLFARFKKELKSTFFMYMWESIQFSPFRGAVNAGDETIETDLLKNDKLRDQIIISARMKLFFFADIVIAFVMGDDKMLKEIKDRCEKMTGKKLAKEKKNVLLKITNKRNKLKKNESSSHRFSWKASIDQTYRELSDQERRYLLSSKVDTKKDVPNRLTDKQIKAISEDIRYHQNEGNLPK